MSSFIPHHIEQARTYFPRGLLQPPGSFRFSIDALLLAHFAAGKTNRPQRGLDLGCGCGVIGFGVMLLKPEIKFCGVDINPALLEAAEENAVTLGLKSRYRTISADLRQPATLDGLAWGCFDLVTANPPFRKPGSGRLPPEEMQAAALFETESSLDDFVFAAARALKNGGRFCCIYAAERLADLCAALDRHKLAAKRIQPVHGTLEQGARLILLEARRQARPGLKWEAPLYLQGEGCLDNPWLGERQRNGSPRVR